MFRSKIPFFISPRLMLSLESSRIATLPLYLPCQGIAHGLAIVYGFSGTLSFRHAMPVV